MTREELIKLLTDDINANISIGFTRDDIGVYMTREDADVLGVPKDSDNGTLLGVRAHVIGPDDTVQRRGVYVRQVFTLNLKPTKHAIIS